MNDRCVAETGYYCKVEKTKEGERKKREKTNPNTYAQLQKGNILPKDNVANNGNRFFFMLYEKYDSMISTSSLSV